MAVRLYAPQPGRSLMVGVRANFWVTWSGIALALHSTEQVLFDLGL
jgi:hypothetical protein